MRSLILLYESSNESLYSSGKRSFMLFRVASFIFVTYFSSMPRASARALYNFSCNWYFSNILSSILNPADFRLTCSAITSFAFFHSLIVLLMIAAMPSACSLWDIITIDSCSSVKPSASLLSFNLSFTSFTVSVAQLSMRSFARRASFSEISPKLNFNSILSISYCSLAFSSFCRTSKSVRLASLLMSICCCLYLFCSFSKAILASLDLRVSLYWALILLSSFSSSFFLSISISISSMLFA